MNEVKQKNIIYLLTGIIIGIFCTGILGILAYKIIKNPQALKIVLPKKSSIGYKSPTGNKGLFLGFEKKNDLSFFRASGKVEFEPSQAHPVNGKYSLMVKVMPDVETPGILWEVYGNDVLDWEGAKEFRFDVYNNSEDFVDLVVRLKSGRDYPKEIYSETVPLKPMALNNISIPTSAIAGSCNLKEMSYLKLYLKSPDKETILYFDNIGTRQPTKEDEKSDIQKSDLLKKERTAAKRALKEGFEVYAASSLDRVFQDGTTLTKPLFTQKVEIKLAKNEFESFQIVVNNGKDELEAVTISIDNLVGENNGTIFNSSNMISRIVGYVETKKPYYPVKKVGMWPDPLLANQSIDIKPGDTQPFWISLYAPASSAAGSYKGTIRIISDGKELSTMPITVKVYDFTLPLASHLKTAFHLYENRVAQRTPQKQNEDNESYSERLKEVNDRYYISMLRHRMNPILNINPLSQEDLRRVDNYLRFGLNNFSIGSISGTSGNEWPEDSEKFQKLFPLYRAYGEALKFNKLLDYTYIYAWDEGRIGNTMVQKVCSMIHEAYPGLKTMVCYHGFWDPERNPGWGDDIDIWCFQIDKFNERMMQKLKNRGMEIWMYVSGPGDSGSPNLALDFDSIDYRIIPWLCWRYDIRGFLYWCVNWWPNVDPFKSAMNTDWEQNGNGLMYYPGQDGPIESLRLEIFLDGMEDYEYLYMLREKVNEITKQEMSASVQELISEARKLLNASNSIAVSMTKFTKDSQVLLDRRDRIAELIEKLNKI